MDQISIYLEKFKNNKFKEERVIEIIKKILEENGFSVNKSEIKIRNENIIIKKTGPEKAELFIKRKTIENKIKEQIDKEFNQNTKRKII